MDEHDNIFKFETESYQDLDFLQNFDENVNNFQMFNTMMINEHLSTNSSSKNTPEYYSDFIKEKTSINNHHDINSSKADKIKKQIKKYEPLKDGEIVYNFDNCPEEYKKARKRVQNRESASRVRNRKKNLLNFYEKEISEINQKNSDLMLENARLNAENNMFKQQIQFLQKVIMKRPKIEDDVMIENFENSYNKDGYILPMKNPNSNIEPIDKFINEKKESPENVYVRIPQFHSGKKHVFFMTIFTMILFIFSLKMNDSSNSKQYEGNLQNFKSSIGFSTKYVNETLILILPQKENLQILSDLFFYCFLIFDLLYMVLFFYVKIVRSYFSKKMKTN